MIHHDTLWYTMIQYKIYFRIHYDTLEDALWYTLGYTMIHNDTL